MKTKLNTFKVPFASVLMLFVMALVMMFTVKADAATASKKLTLAVNTDGTLTADYQQKGTNDIVLRIIKDTTVNGYTVKAGYYYFNKSGICQTSFTESTKMYYTGGNNTATYEKVGAFASGNVTLTDTTFTSTIKPISGILNNKIYDKGLPYTGYYYKNKSLYTVKAGVIGSLVGTKVFKGTYYYNSVANAFMNIRATGLYFKKGKLGTGMVGLDYYVGGAHSVRYGWIKIGKKIYYLRNGKALTGYNKLISYASYLKGYTNAKKALKKGYKTYWYLFNKKGVLYTDLIKYYGYKKFIQKDIKIVVNSKTHNTTFFCKVKIKGKKRWIPAKTVVCATARNQGSVPKGTKRLEKTWNKRWFVYTKTHGAPYRYYQWAVHIKGSKSLFHSSTYWTKKANTLRADLYNQLGTSCTTYCVRHQAYYAKMIYDIATKTNKKRRVWVPFTTSKLEGPFGHVKLTKIKSGTKWDPTDPNK